MLDFSPATLPQISVMTKAGMSGFMENNALFNIC